MRYLSYRFVFVVALFLWGATQPVAFAHQQKAAITSIAFNTNTQRVEIIHRFSLHDAEHAVKRILGPEADIYKSEQTQQHFAEYVKHHFEMASNSDPQIRPILVGHEVDGKHFWVYQEMETLLIGQWDVRHSTFHEIWPSQTNTVNIETNGKTRTLVLNKEAPQQSISLN